MKLIESLWNKIQARSFWLRFPLTLLFIMGLVLAIVAVIFLFFYLLALSWKVLGGWAFFLWIGVACTVWWECYRWCERREEEKQAARKAARGY